MCDYNFCYVYYQPINYSNNYNYLSDSNKSVNEKECKINISIENQWYNNFNELKNFININGILPNKKTILYNWLYLQSYSYKFKTGSMLNETIRNEWKNFIKDDKYKDFFISDKKKWYNNFKELKDYIEIVGKLPCNKTILGNWLNTQIFNYNSNKGIMLNKEIRKEWESFINNYNYKILFWKIKFNELKDFIDINGKSPVKNSSLNHWLQCQIKNYKLNKDLMKNDHILNKWKNFINDDKYKNIIISHKNNWYKSFYELKKYIDLNNKLPIDKDTDLGKWLNKNIYLYNSNKDIMLNSEIHNEWKKFINDDKYEKYFISYEERWYNNFNELKEFIDINDKLPTQETNLGKWLQSQKDNYKFNRNNVPSDKKLHNDWERFINEDNYKHFFIKNEEEWYKNFNELKDYIEIIGNLPIKETNLGKWLHTQKKNYKFKNRSMLNYNIKKEWENFINDNKYKNLLQ